MNMSVDLESFVPTVRCLCGDDPEMVRKLMEMTLAAMPQNAAPAELIGGEKIWAALHAAKTPSGKTQTPGPGYWKQLAPAIKKFLARAGQAGAAGCRTGPDQPDRKKFSGARPKNGFTREEIDLILAMARKHGIGAKTIQEKWKWEG